MNSNTIYEVKLEVKNSLELISNCVHKLSIGHHESFENYIIPPRFITNDIRWLIDSNEYHTGDFSIKCGEITNNEQESSIETTVGGPMIVRFWWKMRVVQSPVPAVNSSYGNYSFTIKDENDYKRTWDYNWDYDWNCKEYFISPGVHILKWTYTQSGRFNSDLGLWLDDFEFIPLLTR